MALIRFPVQGYDGQRQQDFVRNDVRNVRGFCSYHQWFEAARQTVHFSLITEQPETEADIQRQGQTLHASLATHDDLSLDSPGKKIRTVRVLAKIQFNLQLSLVRNQGGQYPLKPGHGNPASHNSPCFGCRNQIQPIWQVVYHNWLILYGSLQGVNPTGTSSFTRPAKIHIVSPLIHQMDQPTPVIKKLLIANRGEIAVRIIRACAEAGITSVAIYADADRHSLHVRKADEAYNIGPESLAGYLNAHRIVNLAAATGCDAVHPGYGFLSENPLLPEICQARGICYVGPGAAVIRKMGDKIQARRAMQDADIPVVPGSDRNLESLDEALALAAEIGYPVMLKATTGGGGRGIRRCNSDQELHRNYDRVLSETSKAFGSAEIFMERCIDRPRHIEVQILADSHGNVVHLFERDCSIQRRHQKLVEIAPSPQLDEEQRQLLGETRSTCDPRRPL